MAYCEDRCHNRYDGDGDKEKHIAQINHAARERRVVLLEQSPVKDETSESTAYVAHDLTLTEGRAQ